MAGERRHPKIAKQEELELWAEGLMSDRDSQPQLPPTALGMLFLLEADYQPSSLQSRDFPAQSKKKSTFSWICPSAH